jgi:hypothetical protein
VVAGQEQRRDPEAVLNALHHNVTGELLRLIDGFSSSWPIEPVTKDSVAAASI